MNDVWIKMAEFLGRLNGESVSRETYVRTPEYEKAQEMWKEKEQEWEDFLETLSEEQREKMEQIKECLGRFCLSTGAEGIYSGVCGLRAGAISFGEYKRNRRTAMDG